MLYNIFHEIYVIQSLWIIPLVMVLSILFYAVVGHIVLKSEKRRAHKIWFIVNVFVFLAIVFAIIYRTILCREVLSYRVTNLMPFRSIIIASYYTEYYRMDLMNTFLFLPVGLSLPFIVDYIYGRGARSESRAGKSKNRFCEWLLAHPIRTTIIFSALLTITVEVLQYVLKVGELETDDVIFNTLGGVLGCLGYLVAKKLSAKKSE